MYSPLGYIAINNPFRYRGYYYDTETGFYYLNARYYDPIVKRFISADHVNYLGANGDLNSCNLYAYCSNNPVMYVDPNGEWILPFAIAFSIGFIFGAIVAPSSSDIQTIKEEKEKEAKKKYNENTVNINGNNPNANLSVTINDDSIVIENSHLIHNSYEQLAILEVCINSGYYNGNQKDLTEMQIEWSGHNLGYMVTKTKIGLFIAEDLIGVENSNARFGSVDFKGVDGWQPFYRIVTLGGLISW